MKYGVIGAIIGFDYRPSQMELWVGQGVERMNPDEWESICNKCGKCCYEKVDLGAGEIVYTDEPCEHLDTATNLCKVYRNRHEVVPECMSLTEHLVRRLHWLPEECAYVEYVRHLDTLAAVRDIEKRKRRLHKNRRR